MFTAHGHDCRGVRRFDRWWYESIENFNFVKKYQAGSEKTLHPKSVSVVKVNGKRVSGETMHAVYVYFMAYIFIVIASVLVVSINNFDFATTFTGVLTTLNNVGPGIAAVGPVENFAKFSVLSKSCILF